MAKQSSAVTAAELNSDSSTKGFTVARIGLDFGEGTLVGEGCEVDLVGLDRELEGIVGEVRG